MSGSGAPSTAFDLRGALTKIASSDFVTSAINLAHAPANSAVLERTISASLAPELAQLSTRLGTESYSKWLNALQDRPPLWIRANTEAISSIAAKLTSEGFGVEIFGERTARLANSGKSLFATDVFQSGAFEIQDLASQMIGDAVPLGATMWDCCAGQGGKTIQLASRSKGKGAIFASDIRDHSLEQLKIRAKRAQLFNIRTFTWDATKKVKLPREASIGFDVVVIDAPCSGSGTWRRNPDGKLRTDAKVVADFTSTQASILQTAATAVKKSGTLVYGTCSAFDCENFEQIENFVRANPDFTLQSATLNGSPWVDADTTFVAVLTRN